MNVKPHDMTLVMTNSTIRINDKTQLLLRFFRLAVIGLISVLLMGATILRNEIWATKLSLWKETARVSPLKARVHYNLGNCYILLDKNDEAILEYNAAMALDKSYLEIYAGFFTLGVRLEKIGALFEAAYCYDVVCKSAPPLFQKQKNTACEGVDRVVNKVGK